MGSLSTYQAPSLGIVVYQLRQCANQFQAVSDSHRQHQRKLSSIHDLSSEDLKQVGSSDLMLQTDLQGEELYCMWLE